MWNTTDARSHSTCRQAWTSLNHRKNVLSCIYRSYHLPFRAHWNTWKTPVVPQCLVNSSKYTSRRNSSIGETSLIFFNRSSRPLQKPYTKCMSQYSTWENRKGILATQYTTKHSLRNNSEYWTPKCISLERHQHAVPRADLRVDKNPSWQLSFLDPKEVHNFQLPFSPKPFNFGYRCFGVFRYSLT